MPAQPGHDALSNIAAEAALLGALLSANPDAIDAVAPRLRPEAFSEPVHERIYRAILLHHGRGKLVTPPLLKSAFQNDDDLKQLGGLAYLARLTQDPAGALIAPVDFADDLAELAAKRLMREQFANAGAACLDSSLSVDAIAAMGEIAPEIGSSLAARSYQFGKAFTAALDRTVAIERGEIPPGVRLVGLRDWDDITGGMHPGDYILVGGPPSSGKTALTLSVARRAAANGHGVLYISREMHIDALMPRMVADLLHERGGQASFQEIRDGKISDADKDLLAEIETDVQHWPLTIIDPETFAADQVSFVIRQQKRLFERRGQKLSLVIIDYLGLIDPPERRASREQEVTAISKALKTAARVNELPIIVLTQLSRGVASRDDKHPQLTDLRDSGSLEQDADIVIFVHREQYYLERNEPDPGHKKREDWERDMAANKDRMEIYSAKHRQGALCRRKAWFFGRHQAVRNSNFYAQEGLL